MDEETKEKVEARSAAWFGEAIAKNTVLMHAASLRVRLPLAYYARGEYISPVNGEPVKAPVVAMQGGDTFIVVPGRHEVDFIPLSSGEAAFFESSVQALADALASTAAADGALVRSYETARLLMIAALRQQLQSIEGARPKKDG